MGAGRFNQAFLPHLSRASGALTVNVPYMIEPFPCENCRPEVSDLARLDAPALLAQHSIAPTALRPL
jgi:hypothetical protein